MFTDKSELPQKTTLQIMQDDKFFCRLLSKETSIYNPSFRITVSVPFVWESQPGTPKYTFSGNSLPPLTPPPSYNFNTKNPSKKPVKKPSRSNLFQTLFPKFNLKKTLLLPSSPSSLSSSSSSSCSCSDSSRVVPVPRNERRRFLSFYSSFDLWGHDEEDKDDADSPSSKPTLCFRRTTSSNVGFGSCCRRKA